MTLSDLRLKKGYTQSELGEKIGVSQQYISKIECGHIDSLTSLKIFKLSKILQINEVDLYRIIAKGRL